jgi:DNA-binding transcriptional ArsR family regulator
MSRTSALAAPPARKAAPLFFALGDETRLALLARLSSIGPASITRLSTKIAVTRQAITKHLEVLSRAGVATSRRSGRERIWEFDPSRLTVAREFLDEVSRHWDDALGRLEAHLKRGG